MDVLANQSDLVAFGAIGFLFGFFLASSITVGRKTEDVFKSSLGIAGQSGGLTNTSIEPHGQN